ncbi:MAG: hypothetical protein JW863_11835 [Chitinispirillaceae bacterium]|nr:hypothetical protein [Chitinispirillaceae bacterium]
MLVQMLAGMFIGSVVASLVWGVVLVLQKSKRDKIRRERDSVMHSIGELWVEIEALISSRHGGGRAEMELRERFSARLDEVNRQLRPNMHLFDAYYVKYTEMMMAHYNRKMFGDTGLSDVISEHEMETGLSYVETPPEAALETVQFNTEHVPAVEPEVSDQTIVEAPVETPAEEAVFDAAPVDEKTASPDTEKKSGVIVEDLFEIPLVSEEPEKSEPDVVIAEEKVAEPVKTPENKDIPVTDDTIKISPLDEEEDVVFEPKESNKDGISATVSAVSETANRMFNDEEFTMETMMDVDINTLSSFLKPGKQETPPAEAAAPSILEEKKEKPQEDLEVVIASNAGHSGITVEEEPVAAELPAEQKKDAAEIDDSIPEETVYTRADELVKKEPAAESKTGGAAEDEFEIMFQEGPVAVEPPEPQQTTATAESGAEELFEAELTDAESDIITGNDVADKIAALEMSPPSDHNKKKKGNGSADAAAAPVEKETVPSKKISSSKSGTPNKAPVSVKRKGRADDSITGDDVADKIDAFFGLFDE